MEGLKPATQFDVEHGKEEVFIDFRLKEEGELIIKLKNLNLKNRKFSILKEEKSHPNILRIFIDTVSRQRFIRRYHKTQQFLKKYHFSKYKKLLSYEFFRFHSIAGYTYPNLIASTYGNFEVSYAHQLTRIETLAKKLGYITGIASDLCNLYEREFDYDKSYAVFPDPEPVDHEFFQVSCDYNTLPINNGLGFFLGRGPFAASKNCFMGDDLASSMLDYSLKFFRKYKEERKFFTVKFIDPHEFTGELSSFIDPLIANFLDKMDKEGHLDNTVLQFYADHGDHTDFILEKTESARNEKFNPFLYMLIPESQKEKIGANLEKNTQKLLTHFDIFTSALKLIGGNIEDGFELWDMNQGMKEDGATGKIVPKEKHERHQKYQGGDFF